jgi:hypothetical protein
MTIYRVAPGKACYRTFANVDSLKNKVFALAIPSLPSRPSSLLNEVETVLASPEFASARQLRDFFLYIAREAAKGRESLDQHDIAFGVLNRDENFDPATDAAVRRLATQLRQRLKKYYAGTGKGSPVEVFLPSRSYVPVLRERAASSLERPQQRWAWRMAAALAAAAMLFTWIVVRVARSGEAVPAASFTRIETQKGDLMGPGANVSEDAIRLGGVLEAGETVFVSMRFTPREERQQAGLLLYQGPDDYVRFGRFFGSRTMIEMAREVNGVPGVLRVNSIFDPEGQTGKTLYLALQRKGGMLRGYTSRDGNSFQAFGEAIPWPETFESARVGIYGLNGRRDSVSVSADFSSVRRGVLLAGASVESAKWNSNSNCAEEPVPLFFAVARIDPRQECIQRLTHAAPSGAWTLETHFEKTSEFGSHLGIGVWGDKSGVSLSRYFNKQPVLAWIWYGVRFESAPDYPGTPPVYLRVRSDGREVWGEASPDGERFERVGSAIAMEKFGKLERVGLSQTFHVGHGGSGLPGYRVDWLSLAEEQLSKQ